MFVLKRPSLVLSLSLLCGFAVLQAEAAPPAQASHRGASARPNIVFILTDDQDLDLQSLDYMPLTRELIAQRGMSFQQDFVPLSLCCPSRSTILTGLYPHNHKVYTNHPPDGGFEKFEALGHEEATVGTALRAAGYRTALLGKYLNHYPRADDPTHVPPGWDVFASPVAGDPYGNFNYTLNENGTLVHYGNAPQDYLTDVIAGKAVDFIRGAAGTGQPFFLYWASYAPTSRRRRPPATPTSSPASRRREPRPSTRPT